MKILKIFTLISAIFLVLLCVFSTFSISNCEQNNESNFLLFLSKSPKGREEIKKAEEIVKEIETAYRKKQYEKVGELLKELPPLFSLTPEENLIVSESFLKAGYPEKAIEFSNKVISVKRGTHEACYANLIKIKALIVKNNLNKAKKELKNFLSSYCEESLKQQAKVLLYFIKAIPEKELTGINKNIIRKTLGEMYKIRGVYFIKKGKLKKAEDDFFTYINVYGTYREAPALLYKIAEAYFKRKEINRAKVYYELIITNWDGTKEALFSKFRLYEIAYERALIKTLLPEKTKQDLIAYATIIKTSYPQEKIAEEASFMIVKVYFEDKKYLSAKRNAISFLKTYEKSPFAEMVKKYYCKSMSILLKRYYQKKDLSFIVKLEKEDQELLKEYKCGRALYTLGNIYLDYNFYTKASCYFIDAYESGGNKDFISKVLLKLGFIALETGKKALFNDIFTYLEGIQNPKVKKNPYYFYLKAYYEMQRDLKKGDLYLKLVLKSSLPEDLKEEILRDFRDRALSLKDYKRALEYTNNKFFKAKLEDYLLLLVDTFYNNKGMFEKVLKYAKEKFPKNSKIRWLEAYYLEREGDIKASARLWKTLTQGNSLENELARSYEKMIKLIEKSHQLVF